MPPFSVIETLNGKVEINIRQVENYKSSILNGILYFKEILTFSCYEPNSFLLAKI
jgi:hypothetical protein